MMAKKQLYQVWVEKMDGRTNKWLHDKTSIAQSELSRILSGKLQPTDEQTNKINAILNKVVPL
jgi:predicted transcriptional regulator